MYTKKDSMKKAVKKQVLFSLFALAFIVGCQGQYPKDEAIDTMCQHEVKQMVKDSVEMRIYYHELGEAIRVSNTGWASNHSAFYVLENLPVYSYTPPGVAVSKTRWKFYVDSFHQQIIENNGSYMCGFYQIRIYKYGAKDPEFTLHFVKCNPGYLGRN